MHLHFVEDNDYNSGPYSVIIPAGMTNVPFDVPIIDDTILEENETFTLEINSSSLPSRITVSNPSQARVVIRNDDCK